jgi:hypothetical protein
MYDVATVRLSVLLFKVRDLWVGQCLEYDIAVQHESLKGAAEAIETVLLDRMRAASAGEIDDPFEGIPQAPGEYWDRYQKGLRVSPEQIQSYETADLPPAFMIHPSDLELRVY